MSDTVTEDLPSPVPSAPVSPAPPVPTVKRWLSPEMISLLLSAVALAGVLWFLLNPPKSEPAAARLDPAAVLTDQQKAIQFAVSQASTVCLNGISDTDKRSIETKLAGALASGFTDSSHVRSYVGTAVPQSDALISQKNTQDCMAAQVSALLQFQKKNETAVPQQVATDPALSASAIGYIYYEEHGGKGTEDGVLYPYAGGPLLPYPKLRVGTVMRLATEAQLRAEPTTQSPIVRTLAANQCVKTLEAPNYPVVVRKASSGGRVKVQDIPCSNAG